MKIVEIEGAKKQTEENESRKSENADTRIKIRLCLFGRTCCFSFFRTFVSVRIETPTSSVCFTRAETSSTHLISGNQTTGES